MVMQDNRCDTNAVPAATDVSLPYALGTTIEVKPDGMASEHMVQTMIV